MDRIGKLTRLICTLLYVCDDHTCIDIYCSVYPQLPPVIGAPWECCGHALGISSPRPLWVGGCATHATPCSVPGYSYFRMCYQKSERNCLTSLLVKCSNPREFFFGGFAKKGYTPLLLRQKGAHLKNIWTIYIKRSMIFYCSPFWRRNTGKYPPVYIQLDKYPLPAVAITPFWRKREIISRAKHQYFQAAQQRSSALQPHCATAFIVPCA